MLKKRNLAFLLCCLVVLLNALLLLLAIGLKEAGALNPIIMCYDFISGGELVGDCVDTGWSIGSYSLNYPVFVPLIATLAVGLLVTWAASRFRSKPLSDYGIVELRRESTN